MRHIQSTGGKYPTYFLHGILLSEETLVNLANSLTEKLGTPTLKLDVPFNKPKSQFYQNTSFDFISVGDGTKYQIDMSVTEYSFRPFTVSRIVPYNFTLDELKEVYNEIVELLN